jgi:hypothetical protein
VALLALDHPQKIGAQTRPHGRAENERVALFGLPVLCILLRRAQLSRLAERNSSDAAALERHEKLAPEPGRVSQKIYQWRCFGIVPVLHIVVAQSTSCAGLMELSGAASR